MYIKLLYKTAKKKSIHTRTHAYVRTHAHMYI